MTATHYRSEIKRLGYYVFLRADMNGYEYDVKNKLAHTVCFGWSQGNRTDALESAYDALKRRLEEKTNEY